MTNKEQWLQKHDLKESELLRAAAQIYHDWIYRDVPEGEREGIYVWSTLLATRDNLIELADELDRK